MVIVYLEKKASLPSATSKSRQWHFFWHDKLKVSVLLWLVSVALANDETTEQKANWWKNPTIDAFKI